MNHASLTWPHVTSRVAAGLLGSYAFVWGFLMFGVGLLMHAGMDYEDAMTLAYLLAFIVFLALFCWAFAAASVVRVWGVMLGGAVVMSAAGWWLTRSFV